MLLSADLAARTNDEIVKKVVELEQFSEAIQNQFHKNGPGTELEYRLAWAKTYLKKAGALENRKNALWSMTEFGRGVAEENIADVLELARSRYQDERRKKRLASATNDTADEVEDEDESTDWKDELLDILKAKVSPAAFERLCQRILRESGFVEVKPDAAFL